MRTGYPSNPEGELMRWWRWVVWVTVTLTCAYPGFPLGVWPFLIAGVVWPLRYQIPDDRITNRDLGHLLYD